MAAALPACYHGAISRAECEDLLGKKNKDGAYLIRDSETIQGAMCLCVYKQRLVYTYRLLQTHSGHYALMLHQWSSSGSIKLERRQTSLQLMSPTLTHSAGGVSETYFKTLDDLIRNYKRRNQGLAMHLRHSVKRTSAMLLCQSQRPPESQRTQMSLPEEDHDYENAPASPDYVEVLPP